MSKYLETEVPHEPRLQCESPANVLLQDDTTVALIKFNTITANVAATDITAAVLTLHVSAAGTGFNQFLVVGIQSARFQINDKCG